MMAVAIALLMILLGGPAFGQTRGLPAGGVSAAGAPRVSERVVASWYYERMGDDAPRLLFLVLYRGQPHWYLRNSEREQHGATGSDAAGPDGRLYHGPLRVHHIAGGLDLSISVDASRDSIVVLGRRQVLTGHNVFLIDRVDGVGGHPEIVRRFGLELDPDVDFRRPGSPDVARIIDRVPALRVFVTEPATGVAARHVSREGRR